MSATPFCQRPVSDGADGGEPCGEPTMPSLEHTCYDHAHVCQGPPGEDSRAVGFSTCGEPTDYNEIFCPQHLGMKDQTTNDSQE